MKLNTLLLCTLFLLTACSDPELEKHQANLTLAIADKNHYSIIKHANSVLLIDSENVEAIAALRDSARVYSHLKDAAENLKLLDETGIDSIDIPWTMETSSDDPKVQDVLKAHYSENFGDITEGWIKKLNHYAGGFSEEDAPSDLAKSTKEAFFRLEQAKVYETLLNEYKKQVRHLVDAKNHLSKAEILDPRFKGVIELEELIDGRAEVFTLMMHIYITSQFMPVAENAATYSQGVSKMTGMFVSYTDMDVGSAYERANADLLETIGGTMPAVFKQYGDNAQILLSIYKDLEDDFDQIDSLEPGIELVESMIEIIRLTDPPGSLRDWNQALSSATASYSRAVKELNQEIEPIEKLNEDKALIETSIDQILDEEVISVIEKSDFI